MARKGENVKTAQREVSGTAPRTAVARSAKPARTSWAELALEAGVHPLAVRKLAFR